VSCEYVSCEYVKFKMEQVIINKCLMVLIEIKHINLQSKNKEYPRHAVKVPTFWSARSGSV